MGPGILLWHYPDSSMPIVNNSLLTVESNHFCVLKSRGAILSVYDTGQYPVETPDRPDFGFVHPSVFRRPEPMAIARPLYVNRSKQWW